MSRHVYGLTVMGNEAHRYLWDFVHNVLDAVDVLFVYDDGSTDGGDEFVRSYTNIVYQRRPRQVPSFLEHEGRFRQASWEAFERYIAPTSNDWVLSIDTDEVLVGPSSCRPCDLKPVLDRAEHSGVVLLDRPEVWMHDKNGWPLLRKDGFWGGIRCTRLFRYQPHGSVKDVPMACGSEPTYVSRRPNVPGHPLQLLHYGYCDDEGDRMEKYNRYMTYPGHDPGHVASILRKPTLVPWDGLIPPRMVRGNASRA